MIDDETVVELLKIKPEGRPSKEMLDLMHHGSMHFDSVLEKLNELKAREFSHQQQNDLVFLAVILDGYRNGAIAMLNNLRDSKALNIESQKKLADEGLF